MSAAIKEEIRTKVWSKALYQNYFLLKKAAATCNMVTCRLFPFVVSLNTSTKMAGCTETLYAAHHCPPRMSNHQNVLVHFCVSRERFKKLLIYLHVHNIKILWLIQTLLEKKIILVIFSTGKLATISQNCSFFFSVKLLVHEHFLYTTLIAYFVLR